MVGELGPITLTRGMPIHRNSDLELRIRRGERPVVVRELPITMFVDAHERQCQRNHSGQTLERIRQRHGFGASEAVAVLTCLDFDKLMPMNAEVAHRILYAMVATHNRGMRVAEQTASETPNLSPQGHSHD